MSDRAAIREDALTELVRLDEEAGVYDPPGCEHLRAFINEQGQEIERLRAMVPEERTYTNACVAALQAKRDGDAAGWEKFAAVARAIEAAWPDAVRRVRGTL